MLKRKSSAAVASTSRHDQQRQKISKSAVVQCFSSSSSILGDAESQSDRNSRQQDQRATIPRLIDNALSSSDIDGNSDNLMCDSDDSTNNDDLSSRRSPVKQPAAALNKSSNIIVNITDLANENSLFNRLCDSSDGTLIETISKLTKLNQTGVISEEALGKIIDLMVSALPKPNIFPRNKDSYLEIVKKLTSLEEKQVVRYTCSNCMEPFREPKLQQHCAPCNSNKTAMLVQNNVKNILKNMFELRGLAAVIETENSKREKGKQDGVISDVCDGRAVEIFHRNSIYDICLVHTTDRINYKNDKSTQIWTNVLSLANIPPPLRSKFTILASIWYSPNKSSFEINLLEFAKDILQLSEEGVTWVHPITKCEINSKVYLVASTMEVQARASVLNMNQIDETFGCNFCEIQGERSGKHLARYYPFTRTLHHSKKSTAVARTTERIFEHAGKIEDDSLKINRQLDEGIPFISNIKGIQGTSPLMLLSKFDLVDSFSPDVLHTCFTGLVQEWTRLIFNPLKTCYVGNLIDTIDDKLKLMQTPFGESRAPKSLKDLKSWGANEFRNWLFYFSLPCLHKVLPTKYLDHHILLVQAMYILCKSKIKPNELKDAKSLLVKYCSEFADLYHTLEESINVHMLLHFGSSVEQIGPLWAHSTLLFASTNKAIRDSMFGASDMASAIINSAKVHGTLSTIDQIAAANYVKTENEITMLGATVPINKIENINVIVILSSIAKEHKIKATSLQVYERVRFKGVEYTGETYCNTTNCGVPYVSVKGEQPESQSEVLKALYFVYVSKSVQLVVGKCVNLNGAKFVTKCGKFFVNHLQNFSVTHCIVDKNIASIECPMIRSLSLLSKPPNNFDLDM